MSNTIFVFGSNKAGRHGRGAALYARSRYGAIYGQAEGLQGSSYAIPTKDANLNTLPLESIEKAVDRFIEFAYNNPSLKFKVTAIGCGLARYKHEVIAKMFRKAPSNCVFQQEWKPFLGKDYKYWVFRGE